jgi:Predicted membrane protein (DUF2306)
MSTLAAGVRPISRVRPKYLLFGIVGLMLSYVLVHDESFLVNPKDPIWSHYEPFKWWLLPHGIAGACALLLGPMQFSERLRCRFRKLHRVLGRIYVVGVFIAAPLGVYIQYFKERLGESMTRSFAVALVFLEGRVVGGVTGWENLGNHIDETIVWACLALSILSADLILQLQELGRPRPIQQSTR